MLDVPLLIEQVLGQVSAEYVAEFAADQRETAKKAFDMGIITGVKTAGVMTMIAQGKSPKEIENEFNTGV